ncbi:MAG: murein L,D-transpeptidase catalytic domain family protein [Dokdonella sp.]
MASDVTRRYFMKLAATGAIIASSGAAWAEFPDEGLSPRLKQQGIAAFRRHRDRLAHVNRIGIVDFARASSSPRFFIVNAVEGSSQAHLVAHGRGSDPAHTGWAQSFSNEPGSFASSIGSFVTRTEYAGHHGRSMRLAGLDPENSNAESRGIVLHAASYVSPEIAARTGMVGRSEGCFAVSKRSLDQIIDCLGPGSLLYAAKPSSRW